MLDTYTDLHCHLGSSVNAHSIWELAHSQGMKLPKKDYHEFIDFINVEGSESHSDYLSRFDLVQRIQSTPNAIEQSVFTAVSLAYRKSNITTLELRFNPMFRNKKGEYDLDIIIISAIHGLKKAMIAYPKVKAGLIISADRTFSKEQVEVLAQKTLKYKDIGIVGFDVSGPNRNFDLNNFDKSFRELAYHGVATTFHTGEVTGPDEIKHVISRFGCKRIGHGVRCVESDSCMDLIRDNGICLELCPTSNLKLGILTMETLKSTIRTLIEKEIDFTINSDGPLFLGSNVKQEFKLLLDNKIINKEEASLIQLNALGHSFIN